MTPETSVIRAGLSWRRRAAVLVGAAGVLAGAATTGATVLRAAPSSPGPVVSAQSAVSKVSPSEASPVAVPGHAMAAASDAVDVPAMAAAPSADTPDDMVMDHSRREPRDYQALWRAATPEERAGATELLAATRAAIERFRDIDVALAAGYRPNGGKVDATHYPNPSRMRDGAVLDPARPESLVYWNAPDGSKVLVGALYKAGRREAAPTPGGALTMWHSHPAPGRMCHPAEDATCDGGVRMLHVYVFDGARDPFTESMVAAAGGRPQFRAAMGVWAA